MDGCALALLSGAALIGLSHTIIGVDHYLPFIVLGRAEAWSYKKTLFWTGICGVGHVLSSIVIGSIGIALGWAVGGMERFEGSRGELASIALLVFGGLYLVWGIWRAMSGHSHTHRHADGTVHRHAHRHDTEPGLQHDGSVHEDGGHGRAHRITVWTVFIIFVLGPCEPLIPLLMVPATEHSLITVAAVAGLFSLVTIGTMMAMVSIGWFGVSLIRLHRMEKWVHAMAGGAILVSGLLIMTIGI